MKTKGIRILDKINKVVSVTLPDILVEIPNGDAFYWSILYVDGMSLEESELPIVVLADRVEHAENGLFLNWKELNDLAKTFHQIYDLVLIGSKTQNFLHHYKQIEEAYACCDIVIEMVDCNFWNIFSKDENLRNKLALKFKDIEFLESEWPKNVGGATS